VYFFGMPRSDWPKAVGARPTTQLEEGAISTSSETEGAEAGRTESPPLVLEKVRGKRAVTNELAHKKRKTVDAAPRKLGGISLGSSQTTRTQSAAMSKGLNNDGALVAPPPSAEAPPCGTEVQSKRGEGVPEQQVEETPVAGATRPLAHSTRGDPRVVPRCSGKQCQF